jgi:hypothetical protein
VQCSGVHTKEWKSRQWSFGKCLAIDLVIITGIECMIELLEIVVKVLRSHIVEPQHVSRSHDVQATPTTRAVNILF